MSMCVKPAFPEHLNFWILFFFITLIAMGKSSVKGNSYTDLDYSNAFTSIHQSNDIEIFPNPEGPDQIVIDFKGKDIDSNSKFNLFISEDLHTWIRIPANITIVNNTFSVELEIDNFDGNVFFTIADYEYYPLSEEEADQQIENILNGVNSYLDTVERAYYQDDDFQSEFDAIFSEMKVLFEEIILSLNDEDKLILSEILYNIDYGDFLNNFATDNSDEFGQLPLNESIAVSIPISLETDKIPAPPRIQNDAENRWRLVRTARSYRAHADEAKQLLSIESMTALLEYQKAGSRLLPALNVFLLLTDVASIMANITPTIPFTLRVESLNINDFNTLSLNLYEDPLPHLTFSASFRSFSNIHDEIIHASLEGALKFVFDKIYSNQVGERAFKSVEEILLQLLADVGAVNFKTKIGQLMDLLRERIASRPGTENEVWLNVPIDFSNFVIGSSFRWWFSNIFSVNGDGMNPVIWDYDSRNVIPQGPGQSDLNFSWYDKLYNITVATEPLTFFVSVLPPLARAGANINKFDYDQDGLEFFTLDGSESFHGEEHDRGKIASWEWLLDGEQFNEGDKILVGLPIGNYEITLILTDIFGQQSTDKVRVVINEYNGPFDTPIEITNFYHRADGNQKKSRDNEFVFLDSYHLDDNSETSASFDGEYTKITSTFENLSDSETEAFRLSGNLSARVEETPFEGRGSDKASALLFKAVQFKLDSPKELSIVGSLASTDKLTDNPQSGNISFRIERSTSGASWLEFSSNNVNIAGSRQNLGEIILDNTIILDPGLYSIKISAAVEAHSSYFEPSHDSTLVVVNWDFDVNFNELQNIVIP